MQKKKLETEMHFFFTEEKKIKFSHKKVSVASIALEMSKKLHLDLRENIKSYNLN